MRPRLSKRVATSVRKIDYYLPHLTILAMVKSPSGILHLNKYCVSYENLHTVLYVVIRQREVPSFILWTQNYINLRRNPRNGWVSKVNQQYVIVYRKRSKMIGDSIIARGKASPLDSWITTVTEQVSASLNWAVIPSQCPDPPITDKNWRESQDWDLDSSLN